MTEPGNKSVPDAEEARYARRLEQANLLTAPAIRALIRALDLPSGSAGLDAACGIGAHALWLAEALGPEARVIGLDRCASFLAQARAGARDARLAERVSFEEGDLSTLPYGDDRFDWAWCADAIYPGTAESGGVTEHPIALVSELARVVKPGGRVALVFWSGHRLLPGHPLLEARLNATPPAHHPFVASLPADLHASRAAAWLAAAGLTELAAVTRAVDHLGPFDPTTRQALGMIFDMLWGRSRGDLEAGDWEEFRRLCDPRRETCILDRDPYHGIILYTAFAGRVPPAAGDARE